jgi:hypothetical protein
MKTPSLLATLLLFSPLSAIAHSIETGQSMEEVTEQLGKPMGSIELREKTLLLYPQGEITLKAGRVTEIDLMSNEQFEADQARLQHEREEWLVAQERLRAQQKAEGEALRDAKSSSPAFAALSAKSRVEYWRNFQVSYPTVDVSKQISNALAGYESELEELRSQQRIAELEARVALAEKEAAAARLETEKLREETERTKNSRQFGLRAYTDPVIRTNRYYYRPPTVTIFTNNNSTKTKRPNNIYRRSD